MTVVQARDGEGILGEGSHQGPQKAVVVHNVPYVQDPPHCMCLPSPCKGPNIPAHCLHSGQKQRVTTSETVTLLRAHAT